MEGYGDVLGPYAGILGALQGRQQAEDTRRWDADFGLRSKQLSIEKSKVDMQYKIAKLNAQTQREAIAVDRWKAEKDYELGLKQWELDKERVAIERGAQGLGLLETDTQLRSQIRDAFKLSDWESGVRANPFAVDALRQLVANTGASTATAPTNAVMREGLPEQNSLQAVLADLGVGQAASDQTNAAQAAASTVQQQAGSGAAALAGATQQGDPPPNKVGIDAIIKKWVPSNTEGWDDKDKQTLGAIAMLAGMGEQKYANRFGQMDQDDQDLLLGGMARLGRNPDRVLRSIDQLRVGNSGSGLVA